MTNEGCSRCSALSGPRGEQALCVDQLGDHHVSKLILDRKPAANGGERLGGRQVTLDVHSL